MSNKTKLHDGERVHVIVAGTQNARVKRLRDGHIYKVPMNQLMDDPAPPVVIPEEQPVDLVEERIQSTEEVQEQEAVESYTVPVTPTQPYIMTPEEPIQENEPLTSQDMRSVRKGLRHLQLEPNNQVGRGPKGPFPTHAKRIPPR